MAHPGESDTLCCVVKKVESTLVRSGTFCVVVLCLLPESQSKWKEAWSFHEESFGLFWRVSVWMIWDSHTHTHTPQHLGLLTSLLQGNSDHRCGSFTSYQRLWSSSLNPSGETVWPVMCNLRFSPAERPGKPSPDQRGHRCQTPLSPRRARCSESSTFSPSKLSFWAYFALHSRLTRIWCIAGSWWVR